MNGSRSDGDGDWVPAAVRWLALLAALVALLVTSVIAQSPLLWAAAVLYATGVGVPVALGRSRAWSVYAFAATVGIAIPGIVTYGVALLPAIVLWATANFNDPRQWPSSQLVILAIAGGATIGFWAILLPVMLSRLG